MAAVPITPHPRWLVVGWPVLLALVVIGVTEYRHHQVLVELSMRPPIAIIPVDEMVIATIEANPSGRVEGAIRHVREGGKRLAENGYVVLDASQVYGYPKDIEARP